MNLDGSSNSLGPQARAEHRLAPDPSMIALRRHGSWSSILNLAILKFLEPARSGTYC
jgi:hypothetical protein